MKIDKTKLTVTTKSVQVYFEKKELEDILTRAAQGVLDEDVTLSEYSVQFGFNQDGSAKLYATQQTREES